MSDTPSWSGVSSGKFSRCRVSSAVVRYWVKSFSMLRNTSNSDLFTNLMIKRFWFVRTKSAPDEPSEQEHSESYIKKVLCSYVFELWNVFILADIRFVSQISKNNRRIFAKHHIYQSVHPYFLTVSLFRISSMGNHIQRVWTSISVVGISLQNIPIRSWAHIKSGLGIVKSLILSASFHTVRKDIKNLVTNDVVKQRLHFTVPSIPLVGDLITIVLLSPSIPEVVEENEAGKNTSRSQENVENLYEMGRKRSPARALWKKRSEVSTI